MIEQETNFIDQLIAEVEAKEHDQLYGHYDLICMEISRLQGEIKATFNQAESEKKLIDEWALTHNVKRQERADYLKGKLEVFMREEEKKTIDLPHAVLKFYKKPDKVEVTDLDLFLAHAKGKMITTIPESVKPSLTGIKKIIKMSGGKVPNGVTLIPGKEELTISFKQNNGGLNDTTTEAGNPAKHTDNN